MTYKFASEIITKLLSGSPEQKAEAILYMNFDDFTELRKICPREYFKEWGKLCGVEVKPTHKCPAGKFYIVRRQNNGNK